MYCNPSESGFFAILFRVFRGQNRGKGEPRVNSAAKKGFLTQRAQRAQRFRKSPDQSLELSLPLRPWRTWREALRPDSSRNGRFPKRRKRLKRGEGGDCGNGDSPWLRSGTPGILVFFAPFALLGGHATAGPRIESEESSVNRGLRGYHGLSRPCAATQRLPGVEMDPIPRRQSAS